MRLQDYGGDAAARVAASLAVLGAAWSPLAESGAAAASGNETTSPPRARVGLVEATELAQALVDLEVQPEVRKETQCMHLHMQ